MLPITKILSKLGPGLLFAGAAIGASHLVQSTRAGAGYGFSLLVVVILANIFKYPFFEYGQRYTAATGESIISGYRRIGRPMVGLFLVLNILTSIISAAGVTIVTAAIVKFIGIGLFSLPIADFTLTSISAVLLILVSLLLIRDSYSFLDKAVKYMIIGLSIFTLLAFSISLLDIDSNAASRLLSSIKPLSGDISFGFLIALVGWMPAPVEASSWTSLWAIEKQNQTGGRIGLSQTLLDFKVGYITTTILACLFLGLGAITIFAGGTELADGAVGFVSQLISLYTENLGPWSLPVICIVALATMASTTLTVVDAYPRAIEESVIQLKKKSLENIPKVRKTNLHHQSIKSNLSLIRYSILVPVVSVLALVVIWLFKNQFTALIDFVTTVSFIAAPIFGTMNVLVMGLDIVDEKFSPPKKLRILSYLSILFVTVLAIWYIVYKSIT